MYKLKIILLLIIIVAISIAGCNIIVKTDVVVSPENSSKILLPDKLSIELYYPVPFHLRRINFVTYNEEEMPKKILDEWENCISKSGNINFKLKYVDWSLDTVILNSIETDKLFYIPEQSMIKILRDSNMITPLNKYLENIDGFGVIDQKTISDFTDDDGNIWALPIYKDLQCTYRKYNQEWLDKLEISIPKTIVEFEKLAWAVKKSDSADDTRQPALFFIPKASSMTCFNLIDIFIAHGCYPNIFGMQNLVYNEENNEYEDIAFSDEFIESLGFIRYLLDNELVFYSQERNMTLNEITKQYRSISGMYVDYKDMMSLGYYLEGTNTENLLFVYNQSKGIAVLRDTEDIQEKLNFFINQAFIDDELLTIFNYGINGYHYEETEKYFIKKPEDEKYSHMTMLTPVQINIIKDIGDEKSFISRTMNEESISISESIKKYTDEMARVIEEHNSDLHYYNSMKQIIINKYEEDAYDEEGNLIMPDPIRNRISDNFTMLLDDVFSMRKTVESAVSEYKEKCKNKEYKSFIAEINLN